MEKLQKRTVKQSRLSRVEMLFVRADKMESRGDARSAFRLMLASAKLADIGAQVNVGDFYAHGIGTPAQPISRELTGRGIGLRGE